MKTLIVAAVAVILMSANVLAMGPAPLAGHHHIGLHAGMWNQSTSTRTEVGIGGVSTSVGSNGGMGGITYGYWMSEGLALNVSVGGMATDIETDAGISGVTSKTGSVAMILIGAKQYFPAATYGTRLRPFVSLAIGPFIGTQQETRAGLNVVTESRTEGAVGGQLGLGTDIRIGSRFLTSAMIAYNLMTDFDRAIGGSRNYSGAQFSFGIGIILGRM